jgi:calcium-dependent protein kinase
MPDLKVALKIISKEKLTNSQVQDIRSEVSILSTLDHPYIVKYYETYEDIKYLYLVMECL